MLRSTKLSGRALELAEQSAVEWMAMRKECADMEEIAVARINERREQARVMVASINKELMLGLGIPEEDHCNHHLDATYREHGDVYLVRSGEDLPQPQEPVAVSADDRKRLN